MIVTLIFGIHIRPTTESMDVRELARRIEDAGFDALFLPEHTHIPTSVGTDHAEGADWLRACMLMFDPFVTLGAVAAVTERLLLGTGVCLVPQHHPITLAKTVATLDVLSGGRVLFGIGAGWNRPEIANHGVDPARRFAVMREHILAMRRIWTEEEPAFAGEFVRFDPIWQWPKPVQRPHPPVLVGGEGPRVLDRVLEYGDAWMPNDHPGLAERIGELQRRAVTLGRAPVPVTVFATPPDPAAVARCAAAGATRCVFNLPSAPVDEALAALRRLTS